jgi:hypothetical protein
MIMIAAARMADGSKLNPTTHATSGFDQDNARDDTII